MVKSVPALNTLVLTQNNVAELADLEVLRGFKKLTFVSLVDNPVTNKEVCVYSQDNRNGMLTWCRTTDTGFCTSRPKSASWTTKRSRTPSAQKLRRSSAHTKSPRS